MVNLREALARHRFDDSSSYDEIFCHESDDSPQVGIKRGPDCQADWQEWVDHFADAWNESCTIRTLEELLVAPAGCILHTKRDGAVEKFSDGHWYLPGRRDAVSFQRVFGELPALLIWHPDWERP